MLHHEDGHPHWVCLSAAAAPVVLRGIAGAVCATWYAQAWPVSQDMGLDWLGRFCFLDVDQHMTRWEDDGMDLLGCVAVIAVAAVIFLVIFMGVEHGI